MKTSTLIKKINENFPNYNAVPASDFYGEEIDGIWIKGANVTSEYELADPILNSLIERCGFFFEPYDGGTAMAFK